MRWTVGKSNDEKSPLNPIQGEMAQKIIQKSLVHAVKYLYDLLTPPVRRVEFFCLSCSCIYVSLQHSSTQIIIIKSTQKASSNQIKSKIPQHLSTANFTRPFHLSQQTNQQTIMATLQGTVICHKGIGIVVPNELKSQAAALGSKKII